MAPDQLKLSDLLDLVQGLSFLGITVLVSFGVLLIVIWVLLPFAVFGVKARLDRVNTRLNEANARLEAATEHLAQIAQLLESIQERNRRPGEVAFRIPPAEPEDVRRAREWIDMWSEPTIPETRRET